MCPVKLTEITAFGNLSSEVHAFSRQGGCSFVVNDHKKHFTAVKTFAG